MPDYKSEKEIDEIICNAISQLLQSGIDVNGANLFSKLCDFLELETDVYKIKSIVSAMIEVKRALRQEDSSLGGKTFLPKHKLH